MTGSTLILLTVAALVLSALAVVLDRVNFPQKPFRSKSIITEGRGSKRDRTGAHIAYQDPDEES